MCIGYDRGEDRQDKLERMLKVKAEGALAYVRGFKIADSPYVHTSAEHWVWRDGYIHSFRQSLKGQ